MKCEKSGNHTISYQSLLLSTTVLNVYIPHVHELEARATINSMCKLKCTVIKDKSIINDKISIGS